MDANESSETRLAGNNAVDAPGLWSPDGSKIAFVSNRDHAFAYNFEVQE